MSNLSHTGDADLGHSRPVFSMTEYGSTEIII